MRTDEKIVYLVQCMKGHLYGVAPGTILEERCAEHFALGYRDAMCLSEKECTGCVEDRRRDLERNANMCGLAGCSGDESECAKKGGCSYVREYRTVQDSPYHDMTRGVSRGHTLLDNPDSRADVRRDQIDYDRALRCDQEENAQKVEEAARKAAKAKCRRCNHPFECHSVERGCANGTKKGKICACPGLVR